MELILFFLGHWYISLFSQTFFLHRYSAHKMFNMSPFWEKFFYVFTYITQGSSFLSPKAYAILHRMHHAYSDTDKDPHTPHGSSNVFTMMWDTKNVYNHYLDHPEEAEERFTKDLPEWKFIEKLGDHWASRVGWGVLYSLIYIFMVEPHQWYLFLLLPFHYFMGPVHGAVVNWCGHMYGYRNFKSSDFSRNTLRWDFLMLGELFQNNHHRHPEKLNFATRKFEIDPAYPFIKILSWVRIIRLKPKLVPEKANTKS